jgi:pimeloyl-ACP methyl ester carboxylesterase
LHESQVRVGDVSLTVRVWGAENAEPLLYWHGLNPFGALELNEAGPAWAELGFHVVAIAAPGIVDTKPMRDLAGYRPSRLADLVVGLADASGLERFAYAGWSWGASIGVHLGARHPERLDALVLLDAGHTDIPGDPSRSLDDVLADFSSQQEQYRFASWDDFLAAARANRPSLRPAVEERLRAGMREDANGEIVPRSDSRAAAAAWHGLLHEQPSSARAALGRSGIPVLLVVATQNDTAEELERFRAAVPQVETRGIDSDHDLLATAAEETIETVGEWLRSTVLTPH